MFAFAGHTYFVWVNMSTQTKTRRPSRPPSTYQRNAIQMAFRWQADDGPLLDVYWVAAPPDRCDFTHINGAHI